MKSKLFTSLGLVIFIGISAAAYGAIVKYTSGDGKIPQGDCLEMMCQYGCAEEEGTFIGHCCPSAGSINQVCKSDGVSINECCQQDKGLVCSNDKCACPADKPIWNGSQCCFDVGCGCNVAKVNGCCPGVVDVGCGCGVPANYTGGAGAYCTIHACCDPQYYCVENKCVRICPIDQTWDAANQKCVCPSEKPMWNGQNCVPCPSDKPLWDGSACVECFYHRAGYYPVNQRCNDVYKPFCVNGRCTCDCETNLPAGMTCKCDKGARFYKTTSPFTLSAQSKATIRLPAQTFIHQANNLQVNGVSINNSNYHNICYTNTSKDVVVSRTPAAQYDGWLRVRTEITEGATPSQEYNEKWGHLGCPG